MGKKQIDRKALQIIKDELVKDGSIGADGKLTPKGIAIAREWEIKNPGPDALILQAYKKHQTFRTPSGKEGMTVAFVPTKKERWHKKLLKKIFRK